MAKIVEILFQNCSAISLQLKNIAHTEYCGKVYYNLAERKAVLCYALCALRYANIVIPEFSIRAKNISYKKKFLAES